MCPRIQRLRSRMETMRRASWSSSPPTLSTRSPTSTAPNSRWSWVSRSPQRAITEIPDRSPSPYTDEEYLHVLKARQRLARREIELRKIIRHCNSKIDVVRRKLVKDLEVMEVLNEEIDKSGTGELREQLEGYFRDGDPPSRLSAPFMVKVGLMETEYIAYVATLMTQKELVEEMHERKQIAMTELDGIAWSDELLARRLEDCKDGEYIS